VYVYAGEHLQESEREGERERERGREGGRERGRGGKEKKGTYMRHTTYNACIYTYKVHLYLYVTCMHT